MLNYIIHNNTSTLSVKIQTTCIAAMIHRIENLSFHTLTSGHKHQTALLVIDKHWNIGILFCTFVKTLHKKSLE